MSTDKIELIIGDLITSKVEREHGNVQMTPMDGTALAELLERGWEIVHSSRHNGRRTVILRRRGK